MPSINGLELEIDGKKCRVNKTVGGNKSFGEWIYLPITDQDLLLGNNPWTHLAIVVNALEMSGAVEVREALKNPK